MTTTPQPKPPTPWWHERRSLLWIAVPILVLVVPLHWQDLMLVIQPVGAARRMVRSGGFHDQLRGANALRRQGPAARDAIPDLLAVSRDPQSTPVTVVVAVQALAAIDPGGPDVVAAAVAVLRRKGARIDHVLPDLVPLIPANAHVEPALLSLLGDPDQITRVDVAEAMARFGPWSAAVRAGVAARLAVETDPVARGSLERLLR